MAKKALKTDAFRLIHIPECRDGRGALSFAEAEKDIPFPVKRVFWIYDVPEGQMRGGHAHWTCHEVVFPVCGSFDIELQDGTQRATFHLERPNCGIVVPAGVWCDLRNWAPGTVCVVMASEPYDATGYEHNYERYLARGKGLESGPPPRSPL